MRIFVVDAFTDAVFRGNPAAVVLLDEEHDDGFLQSVAAEMNLSETAFITLGGEETGLRWFTPTVEVDLCGHATLASAAVLWAEGIGPDPIRFRTRSGLLGACRVGEAIELDFPALPALPCAEPEGLAEVLGAEVLGVYSSRFDWLVELPSPEVVRGVHPEPAALRAFEARGVIVTAVGGEGTADFTSRFFAPAAGIDEDPVTGSAHCVLAPFWAERLGRDELVGHQASRRGGTVGVSVRGERVALRGDAVIVLAGELYPAGRRFSSGVEPGS
jgi:predicted PhzF superfamily epimerase YddE/YHI9